MFAVDPRLVIVGAGFAGADKYSAELSRFRKLATVGLVQAHRQSGSLQGGLEAGRRLVDVPVVEVRKRFHLTAPAEVRIAAVATVSIAPSGLMTTP